MARSATPAQRHADLALGRPLAQIAAEMRSSGLSWLTVAERLREQTKGVVDLSEETLRRWFPELRDQPKSATA